VRQTFPKVILNAPYTPEEMLSTVPEQRVEHVSVVKPKALPPMPELGDTHKPEGNFLDRKVKLEEATMLLAETIDFKKATGKTVLEIIELIRNAPDEKALDIMDRRLTELENA
jgi:hypothetical protein